MKKLILEHRFPSKFDNKYRKYDKFDSMSYINDLEDSITTLIDDILSKDTETRIENSLKEEK